MVVTPIALLVLHLGMFVAIPKPLLLPELPWYNPLVSAFSALAACSVAFLALGRYKVVRDAASYWVGLGFATLSVGLVFYFLSWPGLLPGGGSFIGHSPNLALWTGRPLPIILALFLLCAVLARWPGAESLRGARLIWSVVAWLSLVVAVEALLVTFEARLPLLVTQDGVFTAANIAMQVGLALAFAAGAVLSARRYLREGNALFAYVALCQITYVFLEVTLTVGGRRYDVWWYAGRVLLVGGFLGVMFGLLSEYVALVSGERQKSRELQAKSAELEAALRALSHDVERRQAVEAALRQSNEALRESEERLNLAAESTGYGAFDYRPLTGALIWTVEAKQHFGLGPEARIDYHVFLEGLHPEDRQRVHRTVQEAMRPEAGGYYKTEYRTIGIEDRKERWLSATGRVYFDEAGRAVRLIGATVDITERKRAEEALIRSEKLASAGRMAATVAHEINNPIETVTNVVYLLGFEPVLSAQGRKHLAIAEEELRRVAHLTQQTLGFYRESGQRGAVDVSALVEKVVAVYDARARMRDLTLEAQNGHVCRLWGSTGELSQVVSNLVLNALDAVQPGGKVVVRTSLTTALGEKAIRLTVADTGKGIAPADLARIFDAFFTTKKDFGTGLGLWVTRDLVQKHGGRIRVRTRSGKGTVFSVFLPCDARDTVTDDQVA